MPRRSFSFLLAVVLLSTPGCSTAWAQSSTPEADPAIARLTKVEGEVWLRRAGQSTARPVTRTTPLHEGDRVWAQRGGRALIIYDTPPVKPIDGPTPHTVQPRASNVDPATGASTLWASLWRTVTRLSGGEVETPAGPRQGGTRGTPETRPPGPTLLLPPSSPLVRHRPTLAWRASPRLDASQYYEVIVVETPDSERCWRGGTELWQTTTSDTLLTYPASAPPLTAGTTYRIEVWTADHGGDYACLNVVDPKERHRLRTDKQHLFRTLPQVAPSTQTAFWAAVLLEQGYHGDGLTLLHTVLETDPDHATGRELWAHLRALHAP